MDIRVESYCRLNLLTASVFNFERLKLLNDSIGHPSQKILSFEFAQSFSFQFRASWYNTGLNRSSELKVIAICIFYELPFSITSVSVYYGTQSDIRVDCYYCLHFLRVSIFNFEHLHILRDLIKNLSENLLSFEFAHNFCIQFRPSRYIMGLNRTSEKKAIVFWICLEFLFSMSCISIYYRTQSDFPVKSYYRLNLQRASIFNSENHELLRE